MSRIDGYTFLLEADQQAPSIWGVRDTIAWSSGEPLMIVGPQSIGKSTVAQQLAMARLGLGRPLLGMPITHDGRNDRLLYIAADRPKQVARSLKRLVDPSDHPELRDRLDVWKGPLEFDIGREPARLLPWVEQFGVQTVVIDSLKDVAVDLSKDETGGRVNQAFQAIVAAGIELLILHHQRKGQNGGKPRTLEDVYGSGWLTAGCGSVLLLWGTPGDPVIDVEHLKPPADPVGPLKGLHDFDTGRTTLYQPASLLDELRARGELTPRSAAAWIFGSEAPTASEVEKARRKLKALERDGFAFEHSPGAPAPTVYRATHGSDSRTTHGTHDSTPFTGPSLRRRGPVSTHASLTLDPTLDPDEHTRQRDFEGIER